MLPSVSPLSERATEIAAVIASRLRDPEVFARGWETPGWNGVSTVYPRGLMGASAASMLQWALSDIEPDNEQWAAAGHRLLQYDTSREDIAHLSLFYGWTGIGMAARFARRGGDRYGDLLETLQRHIGDAVVGNELADRVEWSDEYEIGQRICRKLSAPRSDCKCGRQSQDTVCIRVARARISRAAMEIDQSLRQKDDRASCLSRRLSWDCRCFGGAVLCMCDEPRIGSDRAPRFAACVVCGSRTQRNNVAL